MNQDRLRELCQCGHERQEHYGDQADCWDCDNCSGFALVASPKAPTEVRECSICHYVSPEPQMIVKTSVFDGLAKLWKCEDAEECWENCKRNHAFLLGSRRPGITSIDQVSK